MEQTIFTIDVDIVPGQNKIVWLREGIKTVDKELEILETKAKIAVRNILRGAQLSWGIIQGVIRAAGGSITMTTRLIVSAAFGAIQTLYPVIKAALASGIASMNVSAIAASLVGLAQLTSAIAALVTFESDQKTLSLQLRGLNFMMRNIGMMIRF